MKLKKKQLDLKEGLKKEWIITNGIGGFASTTVVGANTRRYHGLLVAPLLPPARRFVVLSKLDECIYIGDESYNLYTNVCKNYISDGYKVLESFEKEYIPEYNFKVKDIKINKKISLVFGRNTVVIKYTIQNGKEESKFVFTPIINFRDFHSLNMNHNYDVKSHVTDRKIKLEIDGNKTDPVYLYSTEGELIEHTNDIFRGMYFLKEEERGFFDTEEDLYVPCRYEVKLNPKEKKEITFVASLEDNAELINADEVFVNEENRLKELINSTKLLKEKAKLSKKDKEYNDLMKDLIISSDTFIIDRPLFGTHSILAGFPWFLDWGRDSFIAFEGLLLVTKRFDLAREVLLTFTRDIKYGLVPNGYSGFDSRPLYNSADSSLLLFEQVNKYLEYTKDYDFIKENLYFKLKNIVENYKLGVDLDNNNIYIDTDGLLVSGTETTQNTWMDAKINGTAITPRNGKVVELNSLWYNALKTLENLSKKFDDLESNAIYKKEAAKHKKAFEKAFYNDKKKCLYDVLGDSKVRPNQLFAISTTYPIIKPSSEMGKAIFKIVTKKLLVKVGLRTLAKDEEGYIAEYSGDPLKRDSSYHQGPAWVWLLGLYFNAFTNIVDDEKDRLEKEKIKIEYEKFIQNVFDTFKVEINSEEGIGSISELYNAEAPFIPGGTFAQAWSVSEVMNIVSKMK